LTRNFPKMIQLKIDQPKIDQPIILARPEG